MIVEGKALSVAARNGRENLWIKRDLIIEYFENLKFFGLFAHSLLFSAPCLLFFACHFLLA